MYVLLLHIDFYLSLVEIHKVKYLQFSLELVKENIIILQQNARQSKTYYPGTFWEGWSW